jgi:hypothetical protein
LTSQQLQLFVIPELDLDIHSPLRVVRVGHELDVTSTPDPIKCVRELDPDFVDKFAE